MIFFNSVSWAIIGIVFFFVLCILAAIVLQSIAVFIQSPKGQRFQEVKKFIKQLLEDLK